MRGMCSSLLAGADGIPASSLSAGSSCPRGWQILHLPWQMHAGASSSSCGADWVQEGMEAPVPCTPPAEFDSEVSKYVLVILCWFFSFFNVRFVFFVKGHQNLFSGIVLIGFAYFVT